MKKASPVITLQRATEQHVQGLCKCHGFEVEGQLLDYALCGGGLTDVYSMARREWRGR
ncbi:hypothetical protein D3C77_06750 [compost metagenome]|uniref:hypothetical protein n=1 Tax=Pseudomonas TaxID=286 RepID=UPI0003FC1437|nr:MULTISPECIES: hypothetical protein [Pseudomonas]MCW2270844.1 putative acetyltransferase [Pseudomonas sp. JUb96]